MMAKTPSVQVSILLYEDASLSLALLMRDVLLRANLLLGREHFAVRLAGRPGLRSVAIGPVTVRLVAPRGRVDHLIVAPLAPGSDPFRARPAEARVITRLRARGTTVHAACLGALVVAGTGLLDGCEATTHWSWVDRARERYPEVRWNGARMVCDAGGAVTAGGFLAAVDLTLALIERACSRAVSREIGRLVLADSVRQHQSVYATSLVAARSDDPRLRRLERWLEQNLASAVTVGQMARVCAQSPRSFLRTFSRAYGCTPRKYVQRKRVESVRRLLRDDTVSVEEAIARVGVRDVPSFRKVFQRELGLSPAQYRKRLRAE